MRAERLRQMAELRRVQPDLERPGQLFADAARPGIDRVAQRPLQRAHLLVGNILEAIGRALAGFLGGFLGSFLGHRWSLAVWEYRKAGRHLYHGGERV